MRERDLQSNIVHLAKLLGWSCYHTHDSRRSQPGFPDLCMVHRRTGRLLFAELKSDTGRVSREQQEWLDLLSIRHEVRLWWPRDWFSGEIERDLQRQVAA